MKYFIDTEFLEGKQKESFPISLLRKETPNTIDLISIGIVSEDGREYYAISKDFNLKEAWNRYDLKINKHYPMGPEYLKEYWIRENVLKPIFSELNREHQGCIPFNDKDSISAKTIPIFNYKNLKRLINKYGKTNKQIAKEVKDFIPQKIDYWKTITLGNKKPYPENILAESKEKFYNNNEAWESNRKKPKAEHGLSYDVIKYTEKDNPEFYAYYADYDWVAFCWLFGKMIDRPKGFPMYCRDLKQMLDYKINLKSNKMFGIIDSQGVKESFLPKENYSFEERLKIIKSLSNYPKEYNAHNALYDARWNFRLYKFLQQL